MLKKNNHSSAAAFTLYSIATVSAEIKATQPQPLF